MNEPGSAYRLDGTPTPDTDAPAGSASSDTSTIVGYLTSFAMTAIATAIAVGIDSQVTIPNLSLLFVVPVVVAAISFDLGPSVCSAILGSLAYNFFLTEPRHTLIVDDPANVWAIGLLFVVGLIVSGVAFTSRRRAIEAALLRKQAAMLQNYSRDVAGIDNAKAIVSITCHTLAALFQVPVVVILVLDGKVVSVEKVGNVEPQEAEIEAAQSSLATGFVVNAGVYPALTSRFDFWPVKTTAGGPRAAIGLAFDPDERPAAPSTSVDIVGRFLALALDRQHFRHARP
jgi:K+-sensing histidine kinase KdpD